MSVKVAVRVRPFNQRELQMSCLLSVRMEGNKTTLLDLENSQKNRDFVFDYSFWSHDGYEVNEQGLNIPIDQKYADQRQVYNMVGKEILNNAWEGYHCCLFAYGQTGAGKSYSMVGYNTNKGIVPITCEEIFKRIEKNQEISKKFEVQVSMLEIYNEKIHDLLTPVAKRLPGGLKVREHKVYGVYVEGLSKHTVHNYGEIEQSVALGNQHRTIASTQMNSSSSRAHTIIQIEFKSVEKIGDKTMEKLSVINLVDLAGSEKVGKTGATGDRLKEAGQINKSLSVLGQVIGALADKAVGKGKNVVVPYRDSSLTRILQNALGGNSKTLMICAISPANDNYDETLSTLRYADQAKKIKNNAIINESDTERMMRQLKEENDQLKTQLMEMQQSIKSKRASLIGQDLLDQISQLQVNLDANAYIIQSQLQNEDDSIFKQIESQESIKQILKVPHLSNVNEDLMLSGQVQYPLNFGVTTLGRRNGQPVPNIVLAGIGIQPIHAVFQNIEDQVYLEPASFESQEFLFCNGDPVIKKIQLKHNDRLIIGTATTMLVCLPDQKNEEIQALNIDYEFCWRELNEHVDRRRVLQNQLLEQQLDDEIQKKIMEFDEERKKEKELAEVERQKQQQKYESKLRQLESALIDKQNMFQEKANAEKAYNEQMQRLAREKLFRDQERERQRRMLDEDEAIKRYRMREKLFIEAKLAKYLPMVIETNLIALELKRKVKMEAKLKYVYAEQFDMEEFNDEAAQRGQVYIQVTNLEQQQIYRWDLPKFQNRYFLIKDILESYYENEQMFGMTKVKDELDPFWDPPEPKFIGQAFLKLESLAYLMDSPTDIPLVGERINFGAITVNLIPTDTTGTMNLSYDIDCGIIPECENPTELLDKRFDFNIAIETVNIEENPCENCYVEYSLQIQGKKKLQTFRTESLTGIQTKPQYNYQKQHTYEPLTQELLQYLLTGTICFEIYGFETKQSPLLTQSDEDPDLMLKRKRQTIQLQYSQKQVIPQNTGFGKQRQSQSRQILRERISSFQILNPSQMRKQTLQVNLQSNTPIEVKQTEQKDKVEQQTQIKLPQPVQQIQPVQQTQNQDQSQRQSTEQVKYVPDPRSAGKLISFEELERFNKLKQQQQPKKKEKDCKIF